MSMQLSMCKACGASCISAVTRNGSKMLLDAVPVKGGTVQLTEQPNGQWPLAAVMKKPKRWGSELHTDHAATCVMQARDGKPGGQS